MEADIAQALNGEGFKADASPLFCLRRRKYCVIILNAMPVNTKKYLDAEGLSYFWEKIKTYVGEAIESGTSDIANKLHFVVPNEKESTEALTANVSGIDALSPGLVVALRMPFDNTASQTLNINNLGAKPIYYQSDSADAGKFPEGSIALLVYETESVATGCFKAVYSYDDNGPDIDDLVKDITLAKRTSMNVGFMVMDNKQFSLHYPRTSSDFSETVRYYYSMGMRFKDYTFPFDGTTVVELASLTSLPETFQLILAFIVNPEETQDHLKYAPAMSEMTELADVDAAIQADGRYTVVLPFNNSGIRRADGYFEITKPEDSYVIKARLEFGETIQNVIDQTTEYADGSTKESVVVLTDVVPAKHTHSFEDLIIDVYQGATENANGVAGLVPSALSEEKDRFLKGDGTWASANTEFDLQIENGGSKTTQSDHQYTSADMGGQAAEYSDTFHLTHRAFIDNTLVVSSEGESGKSQIDAITTIDCSSLTITSSSEVEVFLGISPTRADDFWITYDLTASLTDLLAAGSDGLPMVEDASNAEPVMMPLDANRSELRVSCVDNNDGTYTFTPFVRTTTTEVVEPSVNLLIDNPDGTSSTVAFPVYQGATNAANGVSGFVPAAASADREKFLKADGTWAEVSTAKEVGYSTIEPTQQSTASLDNESIVFYEEDSSNAAPEVLFVSTSGNQSISGVKSFADGINAASVTSSGTVAASQLVGGGSGITGLNGSNISSGTVAVERLPVYQGATNSANGTAGLVPAAASADQEKFLKADGTWAEVSTAKEVGYSTTEPTQQSTSSLDLESFIFYEDNSAETAPEVAYVSLTGNQAVYGVKSFVNGIEAASADISGTVTAGRFNGSGAGLTALNAAQLTGTIPSSCYTDTTYSNFVGSGSNAAAGLVPSPGATAGASKFLCENGSWETVNQAKEVGYFTTVPTEQSTADFDNQGIIFCETSAAQQSAIPVTTTGNQAITGIKTFINGIYGGVVTLGSEESAFDLTRASCFLKTVTGDIAFSFTNVPSDVVCCITVALTNAGGYAVTWPSSVKWCDNATPVLTQNGKDILTFITFDGGANWYGTASCTGVTA